MTAQRPTAAFQREQLAHIAAMRRPGGFSAWAHQHLGVTIPDDNGDILGAHHAATLEAGIARRNETTNKET